MIDSDKSIYDVYLVTFHKNMDLTTNISERYCLDLNFKNAILANNLKLLKRILVQSTNNSDEFKEIITDKRFRSCIVYTTVLNNLLKIKSFSNFLIKDYVFIKATEKRIEDYIIDYKDEEEYTKELDSILNIAKDNYLEMINSKKRQLKIGGEK